MQKIWLPFTQMQLSKALPSAVSAQGSCIYLKDGSQVIDAISSWWVITFGHCEPALVRAIQDQAQKMDQVLFANFTHAPAQNLIKSLKGLLPKELAYVFFSDNGSTAVECALKMAVQSFRQKNQPQRKGFISFKNSYHGDTVGAMSVSGRGIFTRPYEDLLFSVIQADQGRLSSDPVSAYLDDFSAKLKTYHKHLAGVIIEPFIQGAGGMIIWPAEALEEICHLSKKKGLYLIFDEVMTGFGRTGEVFAFQKLGITPDLLCLSKGLTGGFLPLALTVANQEVYDSFLSKDKEKLFFHGHSFTGNPLSCAVASASLRQIQQKKWKKEWQRIEQFHQKKISALKGHKNLIDARGMGVVAVLEFRLKAQTGYASFFAEELSQRALKRGVFLRPLGNIVYILPPYCISKQELEQVWSVIEEELSYL